MSLTPREERLKKIRHWEILAKPYRVTGFQRWPYALSPNYVRLRRWWSKYIFHHEDGFHHANDFGLQQDRRNHSTKVIYLLIFFFFEKKLSWCFVSVWVNIWRSIFTFPLWLEWYTWKRLGYMDKIQVTNNSFFKKWNEPLNKLLVDYRYVVSIKGKRNFDAQNFRYLFF